MAGNRSTQPEDGTASIQAATRSWSASNTRSFDKPLRMRLVSWTYSDAAAMRKGRGEIVIDCDAALPAVAAAHQLTLENRHQRDIAVCLVTATLPSDSAIRIVEQRRNTGQSWYRLDFIDTHASALAPQPAQFWAGVAPWLGAVLLVFTTPVIVAHWLLLTSRRQRGEQRV